MCKALTRFINQVSAQPDQPAVVTRDRCLSYAELYDITQRLAAAISETGEHPRVLITLPPGPEAYAAMFATLMAGGFYAPMNVNAPLEKQRGVAQRFQPEVVIGSDLPMSEPCGATYRLIDPNNTPTARLDRPRLPHRLAYVIFTSGSTGAPKGVMISCDALDHYVTWIMRDMGVTPEDRWSQHPNIGFDLSVLDIYGALCGGATLFPLTSTKARLAPATAIKEHKLTVWNSVPSVIDMMVGAKQLSPENVGSLRLMTFCGEPLLPTHLSAIFDAAPGLLVHNTYGPTEATVSCTLRKLYADTRPPTYDAPSVPLGDAIEGMSLRLIGSESDDIGEIVISGPQVADGYWNDPETTSRHFQRQQDGSFAYHTGDWANRIGGELYFRHRLDHQVKINGFRVELDEINAALHSHGISSAWSVMIDGELHSFVEDGPTAANDTELRRALSERLEHYAIPKHFHRVEALPISGNDKLDQDALIAAYRSGEIH